MISSDTNTIIIQTIKIAVLGRSKWIGDVGVSWGGV